VSLSIAAVTGWPGVGLANLYPQESHIICKDSPKGFIYAYIHRRPLFSNNDIYFYSLILNVSSIFEQYVNNILVKGKGSPLQA
jgi:hypothetical protein